MLERIAAGLHAKRPLDVECTVASGDPAEELLGYASRLNVDVTAAGSNDYGFLGRTLIGERLDAAGPRRPVLIAPPASALPELPQAPASGAEAASPPLPGPAIASGPTA